jgi:hypothetical protein
LANVGVDGTDSAKALGGTAALLLADRDSSAEELGTDFVFNILGVAPVVVCYSRWYWTPSC